MGYSSLAVAHAFRTLTDLGTVEEALAELRENEWLERIVPVPLHFRVVEQEPGLPVGHLLMISGGRACSSRYPHHVRGLAAAPVAGGPPARRGA